ncbi:hypothetical protein Tco_0080840 [Tanacetum coccineum]
MDTAYGRMWICRIGNYEYAFSCEDLALIRRISFPGYGVLVRLWYLDSGCSKHMTGHLDKLINFVSMFIGTARFSNDHFAAIIGYGDLQIGNILI